MINRFNFPTTLLVATLLAFSNIAQGQQPETRLPGTKPTPSEPVKELPPFDPDKFFYSLGMDTALTAKGQEIELDYEQLRKGIIDGMNRAGPDESYLYGLQLGARLGGQIRGTKIEVDLDQYLSGVRDIAEGRQSELSGKEAEEQSQAFNREVLKQKGEYQGAISKVYLERNKARPSVKLVATGEGLLQVEALEAGDLSQKRPSVGDRLTVNYNGYLLDGTKWRQFTSSEGVPQEVVVGLEVLGRGLDLAFEEMSVGSRYRFVVPPDLGFGGTPPRGIPPNTVLLFDVRLHSLVPGKLGGTKFPGQGGN